MSVQKLFLACSYCHHINHGIVFKVNRDMTVFICEACGNDNYIIDPLESSRELMRSEGDS